MSIFGLPLYNFQVPSGVDMGDLEFIQEKVLLGDYFQVSGDILAATNFIEFVPDTGKTAFLIEAKIVMVNHTTGTNFKDAVTAILTIDGVTKDTTNIGVGGNSTILSSASDMIAGSGSGVGDYGDGKFNVLGLSLVGDSVKPIRIVNNVDDGTAFATMSGYLIDT